MIWKSDSQYWGMARSGLAGIEDVREAPEAVRERDLPVADGS
jgi:hypothetical protein